MQSRNMLRLFSTVWTWHARLKRRRKCLFDSLFTLSGVLEFRLGFIDNALSLQLIFGEKFLGNIFVNEKVAERAWDVWGLQCITGLGEKGNNSFLGMFNLFAFKQFTFTKAVKPIAAFHYEHITRCCIGSCLQSNF